MSDFSCNVKENIKRLETSLNVERNFDILQREVIIAGRKAGFFFIDGFVREVLIYFWRKVCLIQRLQGVEMLIML